MLGIKEARKQMPQTKQVQAQENKEEKIIKMLAIKNQKRNRQIASKQSSNKATIQTRGVQK